MTSMWKIAVAGLLAATPVAVAAHHGWSSYIETEPVTLRGHFTEVTWGNPHGAAKMIWQGKEWDVVLAPVSRMTARGLQLEDVNAKQRVAITGYLRRDGTPEMRIERIEVAGKTIELR